MDSIRTINGKWGELWIEGELAAEVYGFQAKLTLTKESVPMCGHVMIDKKVMSVEGTGSVRMYKVYSRMIDLMADGLLSGRDTRFTLISKLADPDAFGAERIAVTGVSFDDLTLADWEVATLGKIEAPFTFSWYELLDRIGG